MLLEGAAKAAAEATAAADEAAKVAAAKAADGNTPTAEELATEKAATEKAAADKVVADKAAADKEGETKDLVKTFKEPEKVEGAGVEGLGNFIEKAGFGADQVQAYLFQHGKLPDEVVAGLEKTYGTDMAALVTREIMTEKKAYEDKVEKDDAMLYKQLEDAYPNAGQDGKETWTELNGWAKENVSEDTRADLRLMIEDGGLAAQLAVQHLTQMHQSGETFIDKPNLVNGDGKSDQVAFKPLGRGEYSTQLQILLAKGKNENSPEVLELNTQRQNSIKRGF